MEIIGILAQKDRSKIPLRLRHEHSRTKRGGHGGCNSSSLVSGFVFLTIPCDACVM